MKQNAFTLIELIVVVMVVSMLIAIMIPTLARAKEEGRDLYCQNNLHQMYLAATVYVQDHKGYLPIGYYTRKTSEERIQYCWDFTVRRTPGSVLVEAGILWQGETTGKIQQCPSFRGSSNTANDPYTGYNYNTSYLGHGQQEGIIQSQRYQNIRYPAGCALFGDGQTITGANKFMRSPLPSESDWNFIGRWGGAQGYRHSGTTNVAWCDGSIQSRSELFTGNDVDGTREVIVQYNQENPLCPIGFLSEDNSAYD